MISVKYNVSLAPIVGSLLFGSACFHPWWVLFFFHPHPQLFRGLPPHVPSNFGPEYPPGLQTYHKVNRYLKYGSTPPPASYKYTVKVTFAQ